MDEQGEGQIGIGRRVGCTQLHAAEIAVRGRDADELRAVLVRPGHKARRFELTEAGIGVGQRIEEGGKLMRTAQDARDELLGDFRVHALSVSMMLRPPWNSEILMCRPLPG